jgi:hypothetical protein
MVLAEDLIRINGTPAHPLLVHAVVVLLPLAAVCAVALALVPRWRRKFGWPVLLLTAAAAASVFPAQKAGEQLRDYLAARIAPAPLDPAIIKHTELGNDLLPFALGFLLAVIFLFVAGRLADREHTAVRDRTEPAEGEEPAAPVSRAWRRVAVIAAILVIATAVATTVEVVRVGDSGSQAVWTV